MASDAAPAGATGKQRVRGVTHTIPIVTGSIAHLLESKASADSAGATHQWIVFFRPYPPGGRIARTPDLSHLIERVEFHLHSSFEPPVRVFKAPPYSVTEVGWGEFEVIVRIHWRDAGEKPVDLYHLLKLFPAPLPPAEVGLENVEIPGYPVVNEVYDEIVVPDPVEAMHKRLRDEGTPKIAPPEKQEISKFFRSFEGEEDMDWKRIAAARERIAEEVKAKHRRYEDLETEKELLIRQILERGGKV